MAATDIFKTPLRDLTKEQIMAEISARDIAIKEIPLTTIQKFGRAPLWLFELGNYPPGELLYYTRREFFLSSHYTILSKKKPSARGYHEAMDHCVFTRSYDTVNGYRTIVGFSVKDEKPLSFLIGSLVVAQSVYEKYNELPLV